MLATLRNQRFWYELAGEHGTPVVLIMGFGISGRAWAPQVDALKQQHRVLIFDNRGIGGSAVSKVPYGFADLADDTVALMDHVGFGRAHVVGVSMGGMISQHIAIRHPARVRSLSLIATFPGGSLRHTVPPPRALQLFVRANTSRGAKRIAALRRLLYTDSFLETVRPENGFSAGNLEVFAVPADTTTRLNQLRAVLRHDVTRELARIDVPTLIIKPEDDKLVRPHNSERLHQLIRASTILRLVDAGHGATHQRADDVNRALMDHFNRAEALAG
ncbi:MAG: alpha/beta hydrolase [Deltaproteobacteria bacterium]|nr:alpha/beta hydrolase [Deltaproteobacteria bacterium]